MKGGTLYEVMRRGPMDAERFDEVVVSLSMIRPDGLPV